MARPNNVYDPFITSPGGSGGGFLLSTVGSTRPTADGQAMVADRFSNRPLMVMDPADFPGEYANNLDLIIRDLNRMLGQYHSGRKVQLPSWCADFD